MDPNLQPQNPNPTQYGPPGYGPVPQQTPPNPNFGLNPGGNPGTTKSRLPLVIGVAAGVLLLLIIGVIILASSGNKNTKPPITDTNIQTQGPQPATAIGVTQTDTSISQDLSTINDDKDLVPTMLDDKTLGL